MKPLRSLLLALAVILVPSVAEAQGEDGKRAQRNSQIILSMLPGQFDNINQVYFAKRLRDPETRRSERAHVHVSASEKPGVVRFAFRTLDRDGNVIRERQFKAALAPEPDGQRVRMRFFETSDTGDRRFEGCDLLWKLEASQFRAEPESETCTDPSSILPRELQLGEDDLWRSSADDQRPALQLERARIFQCYIDVPGVGGGRDIPYRRYRIQDIHDKGGEGWAKLEDGTEVGVRLTNVRWPMNNLKGIFTRHSFVVYLSTRANGEQKEVAYSWTHPDAQRIGMNVKTALVNCFMLNNEEIKPFFRNEPRL